jgi:hypothetical protein
VLQRARVRAVLRVRISNRSDQALQERNTGLWKGLWLFACYHCHENDVTRAAIMHGGTLVPSSWYSLPYVWKFIELNV